MEAHFVPADWAQECHECQEPIAMNALIMRITIREPSGLGVIGRFTRTNVNLCESCGKLYLISQEKTGSRTP
jgi:hypothetical protein